MTNTGAVDGDEVAQIYATRDSDQAGPARSLRCFKRVHIAAGQTVTVKIPVKLDLYDPETGKMEATPDVYTIQYGGTSDPALLHSLKVDSSLAAPSEEPCQNAAG